MKVFSGRNSPIGNTKDENDTYEASSRVSGKELSKKEPLAFGDDNIMQKELREHGLSSMKTWFLWFKRAGGIWFGMIVILLMGLDRFFYVVVEWFLAYWTTG